MPSRRRPAEPSPRLLAMLGDGGSAGTRGVVQGSIVGPGSSVAPGGGGDYPARSEGAATAEPWLPRRDWLEGGPAKGACEAEPGRSTAAGQPVAQAPSPPGRHRRPRPPGPALLTVPAALRGARVTAPRTAAVGMVLVVLLAVGVFGVRVAWARAASAPQPVEHSTRPAHPSAVTSHGPTQGRFGGGADGDGPGSTGGGPSGRPTPTGSASAGAGEVVVHVVGQVRRPGVVVLVLGARVGDALAKAGGALPGADLRVLNLARVLVDGEQVWVPKPGEAPATAAQGALGTGAGAGGGGDAPGALVNLNTASAAALEELPGVGPVLAQRIVDWRTDHGRFTSVDELAEVSGIGEKMFAALQDKVTV